MHNWVTKFLVGVLVIFITSSSVSWEPHDHPATHHLISPFNKTMQLPNHCILQGHSLNNPCPHLKKESVHSLTISAYCGGAPFEKQTVPEGTKAQKVFFESDKYLDLPNYHSIFASIDNYSFILSSPLFHPPQLV